MECSIESSSNKKMFSFGWECDNKNKVAMKINEKKSEQVSKVVQILMQ